MWTVLKRTGKWLLVGLGSLIIVVALGIGGFRLLFTQLPGYQSDLKAWVARELRLSVSYDHLDARWGLRGPELTFYDAQVGSVERSEPFLLARRVSVSFEPWALITRREFAVSRLTFSGTRVTVVRAKDGTFQFQGAPAGARFALADEFPSHVNVVVDDSDLRYIDRMSGRSWQFSGVGISFEREPGRLTMEIHAVPPAELGDRLELSAEGRAEPGASTPTNWRVYVDLRNVHLGPLAAVLPTDKIPKVSGTGDVSLWLDWTRGRLGRATTTFALDDVSLPAVGGADPARYEHLGMTAEWFNDPAGSGWTVAFNNVNLRRNGRDWRNDGNSTLKVKLEGDRLQALSVTSDFLRLEDLDPILRLLPESTWTRQWFALNPKGDLTDLDLSLQRRDSAWDYRLAGGFSNLDVQPYRSWPGVAGLSGRVRTDSRTGRVEFDSSSVRLNWPELFRQPLNARNFRGVVVWRQGRNAVRVVTDDLALQLFDGSLRSNLELSLPLDGGSPRLDMQADLSSIDLVTAKRLLPTRKMPQPVVDWLDHAIQGGRASHVQMSFFGALKDFPFDDGGGQFRVAGDVENGRLQFVDGWPRAERLHGTVQFVNAGFVAHGAGRVLGLVGDDAKVAIADMRKPVLTVDAQSAGPLGDVLTFLNSAPLIAHHLGPAYQRLKAHAGKAHVKLDLRLPLQDMPAYQLHASLGISGGDLSVDGFAPHATEIDGKLTLDNAAVSADGIRAIFLDGPVTAGVKRPGEPGYRAELEVDGETTAEALQSAFDLPFENRIAGQTRWHGDLLIPEATDGREQPVRIEVASNLTGIALKFPEPFNKAPADPSNFSLQFVFPQANRLQLRGNLGASRRFAATYVDLGQGFTFSRGAVQFGGDQPKLPEASGLTISGSLPSLNVDDWLALAKESGAEPKQSLLLGANLNLAQFSAFGQDLGSSQLVLRRGQTDWLIHVDSRAIAGDIKVPLHWAERPQIVADMQRLYLSAPEQPAGKGESELDPRQLLGLSLRARQFAVGKRELGQVKAEIFADPLGLRMASFQSAATHFHAEGSGSWLMGPQGPSTRIALSVTSDDVAAALKQLGFDNVLTGKSGDVTASLHWPGGPTASWLDHVGGDASVHVKTGSMLDIDPGAGRVLGLMSVTALPRRLALDFRDVFKKGFVFDDLSGDFLVVDGNAYTDNLKMSGPAAEIGVVGRTGLRDHDYQQQAIVTAEPSNMLPTVGGLLGGPGVGAALLIFTRIFKQPLKGIGQASYCVTGTWDAPVVKRLTQEQLQQKKLCAALPPKEAVAQRETQALKPETQTQ